MRLRPRSIRTLVLVAAFIVLSASRAGALTRPPLRIQADPTSRSAAAHLAALPPDTFSFVIHLTGATDMSPVRVIVAGETTELARSTPAWIAGFAEGSASTIVVFPGRASSYPNNGLDELIRHEMSHILTWRAANGRDVPRWFNEGLAMTAGRSWSLDDRRRLTLALVTGSPIGMPEVNRAFLLGEVPAGRAYAISEAFVRDVMKRHGEDVPRSILEGVSRGLSFGQAFERATGEPLARAESVFWKHLTLWDRWIPIVTSSLVLWILIALLALLATGRRRARDAAIRRRWAEEDRMEKDAWEADALEDEDPDPWIN